MVTNVAQSLHQFYSSMSHGDMKQHNSFLRWPSHFSFLYHFWCWRQGGNEVLGWSYTWALHINMRQSEAFLGVWELTQLLKRKKSASFRHLGIKKLSGAFSFFSSEGEKERPKSTQIIGGKRLFWMHKETEKLLHSFQLAVVVHGPCICFAKSALNKLLLLFDGIKHFFSIWNNYFLRTQQTQDYW